MIYSWNGLLKEINEFPNQGYFKYDVTMKPYGIVGCTGDWFFNFYLKIIFETQNQGSLDMNSIIPYKNISVQYIRGLEKPFMGYLSKHEVVGMEYFRIRKFIL